MLLHAGCSDWTTSSLYPCAACFVCAARVPRSTAIHDHNLAGLDDDENAEFDWIWKVSSGGLSFTDVRHMLEAFTQVSKTKLSMAAARDAWRRWKAGAASLPVPTSVKRLSEDDAVTAYNDIALQWSSLSDALCVQLFLHFGTKVCLSCFPPCSMSGERLVSFLPFLPILAESTFRIQPTRRPSSRRQMPVPTLVYP
jgi:hypothetical protein